MVSDELQDLAKRPIAELIADPLKSDHEWFRQELERLVELSSRVGSAQESHPDFPAQLGSQLLALRDSMNSHIESEENVVFSLVSSGQAAQARDAIRGLELEHIDLDQAATQLRKLTSNYSVPEDAGADWFDLYASLAAFEARKKVHTQVESEILFPRVVYADVDTDSTNRSEDKE